MGEDGEVYDNPKLTGLRRYFNGETVRGRANVAKATYGTLFLFYIMYKVSKHLPDRTAKKDKLCPCTPADDPKST